MRRRDFIMLAGSASGWPLAARAQQAERMRRIGVLMSFAADDLAVAIDRSGPQPLILALGWFDPQKEAQHKANRGRSAFRCESREPSRSRLAKKIELVYGDTSIRSLATTMCPE